MLLLGGRVIIHKGIIRPSIFPALKKNFYKIKKGGK